jgi:hypothetical protein
MLRVHLLATPAALWKAGHESNPGTPPGASGSQSNSTKPKNNLRPAPRDGMALVPLRDTLASFGTAAVLPLVVIGSVGNAGGGLGTRSWAAVSELSASSATVVRAALRRVCGGPLPPIRIGNVTRNALGRINSVAAPRPSGLGGQTGRCRLDAFHPGCGWTDNAIFG